MHDPADAHYGRMDARTIVQRDNRCAAQTWCVALSMPATIGRIREDPMSNQHHRGPEVVAPRSAVPFEVLVDPAPLIGRDREFAVLRMQLAGEAVPLRRWPA
jgi:hypothetical protein